DSEIQDLGLLRGDRGRIVRLPDRLGALRVNDRFGGRLFYLLSLARLISGFGLRLVLSRGATVSKRQKGAAHQRYKIDANFAHGIPSFYGTSTTENVEPTRTELAAALLAFWANWTVRVPAVATVIVPVIMQ